MSNTDTYEREGVDQDTVEAVRTLTPQPIERSSSSMSGAGGMTLSVPTQNKTRSVLSSERF